jgi:hypothetical protein
MNGAWIVHSCTHNQNFMTSWTNFRRGINYVLKCTGTTKSLVGELKSIINNLCYACLVNLCFFIVPNYHSFILPFLTPIPFFLLYTSSTYVRQKSSSLLVETCWGLPFLLNFNLSLLNPRLILCLTNSSPNFSSLL